MRLQRAHIFFQRGHVRFQNAGYPSRPRQATRDNGFSTQQGMIQTAESHADDQHDRQIQCACQRCAIPLGAERHAKTADAFHDHHIGQCGQCRKADTMVASSIVTPVCAAAICGAGGGTKA